MMRPQVVYIASTDVDDLDEVEEVIGGPDEERVVRLNRVCQKYSDPFRPESWAVSDVGASGNALKALGSEVVFLFSQKSVASVCVPHKIGSHSWGRFVQSLPKSQIAWSKWQALSWEDRFEQAFKVVVVRHPFDRLISVYRMIFQNWCDPTRFLAKQWRNVCQTDFSRETNDALSTKPSVDTVTGFLKQMLDEHQHGNDRFIQTLWQKFHPNEELTSPKDQLRFTFPEFVRFLVNGTAELGPEMADHKGLSYHWAPYWRECSLCSPQTRPQFVIHLETFQKDLDQLMNRLDMADQAHLFPHTHRQEGGQSSRLRHQYFSTLSQSEVLQLYDKYRLDHELFGYSIQEFLSSAQIA
ncbi:hypothetical protein TCAL_03565 [Tigriopus californicus]|uniref:Carbohydrate sulfotransferase n=1 Tax=Tigriopus californicus TaxID=6832 RepID=A0A553NEB1_TIGCA|nr:hypothetical protein TCAL_03565 [Tigriopus californicus]